MAIEDNRIFNSNAEEIFLLQSMDGGGPGGSGFNGSNIAINSAINQINGFNSLSIGADNVSATARTFTFGKNHLNLFEGTLILGESNKAVGVQLYHQSSEPEWGTRSGNIISGKNIELYGPNTYTGLFLNGKDIKINATLELQVYESAAGTEYDEYLTYYTRVGVGQYEPTAATSETYEQFYISSFKEVEANSNNTYFGQLDTEGEQIFYKDTTFTEAQDFSNRENEVLILCDINTIAKKSEDPDPYVNLYYYYNQDFFSMPYTIDAYENQASYSIISGSNITNNKRIYCSLIEGSYINNNNIIDKSLILGDGHQNNNNINHSILFGQSVMNLNSSDYSIVSGLQSSGDSPINISNSISILDSCDITNNNITNSILVGSNCKIYSNLYNNLINGQGHIAQGELNQTTIIGSQNQCLDEGPSSSYNSYNFISGHKNTISNSQYNIIGGNENYIRQGGYGQLVAGQDNSTKSATGSAVVGSYNCNWEGEKNLISGTNNTLFKGDNNLITGTHNANSSYSAPYIWAEEDSYGTKDTFNFKFWKTGDESPRLSDGALVYTNNKYYTVTNEEYTGAYSQDYWKKLSIIVQSATRNYQVNEYVKQNNYIYKCLQSYTSDTPHIPGEEGSQDYWSQVTNSSTKLWGPSYLASSSEGFAYEEGEIIKQRDTEDIHSYYQAKYDIPYAFEEISFSNSSSNNVVGGSYNTFSGSDNAIFGYNNNVSGNYNLVSGQNNTASGSFSFAGGQYGTAQGINSFCYSTNGTTSAPPTSFSSGQVDLTYYFPEASEITDDYIIFDTATTLTKVTICLKNTTRTLNTFKLVDKIPLCPSTGNNFNSGNGQYDLDNPQGPQVGGFSFESETYYDLLIDLEHPEITLNLTTSISIPARRLIKRNELSGWTFGVGYGPNQSSNDKTMTYAIGAVAIGTGLVANNICQTVLGRGNIVDDSKLFILGNGKVIPAYNEDHEPYSDSLSRSNALTVDWDGNQVLAGKLTVGAAPTANMDVTTKTYVDTADAAISVEIETPITGLKARMTTAENAISALETTVGDSTSGLVKNVSDLQSEVETSTTGLIDKTSALETTVGDSNSGLVHDVSTLKTTVGDNTSGLVKDVSDIKQALGSATRYVDDNPTITTSGTDTLITLTDYTSGDLTDIYLDRLHYTEGLDYTVSQVSDEWIATFSNYPAGITSVQVVITSFAIVT